MDDQDISVQTRTSGDTIILDIAGDVTIAAEKPIVAVYKQQAENGGRKFALNFGGVGYLNSSGIAIVLSMLTTMRKQEQQLAIYGLNAHFKKMLHLVGVDRYARLCDSEEEAVAALGGTAA